MLIFTWVLLGLVALLLVLSGVSWLLFILLDDSRWKQLAVKVFRWAMVGLLFYINGVIWAHVVGAAF
jgi:hypothetical protein